MVRPQLWNGADVRWVGDDAELDGVHLERHERAVVVDAGGHHVPSFMSLSRSGDTGGLPGVVIRLADGQTARVPREKLELVAPDHPLRPEPDEAATAWVVEDLCGAPAWCVGMFVPERLPAVCRVLHPWTRRDGSHARWYEILEQTDLEDLTELGARVLEALDNDETRIEPGLALVPGAGELDRETAQRLVAVLRPATDTPEDVFVAVWRGWGDIPPQRFPGAAHLELPYRDHFLLRGPLEGVLTSVSASSVWEGPVSGLWWPADRAWLVNTEIEYPWTFVAGSRALVDRLLDEPDLEAVPTRYEEPADRL